MNWRVLFCVVAVLPFAGCGQSETTAPPAAAVEPSVEVRVLTALTPGLRTHVTVDAGGRAYWVQESADGHDTLFRAGPADVPERSGLTSETILDALPELRVARRGGASGNIQSLARGPGESLLFYFAGGSGRDDFHAVGSYDPVARTVRVLAGTAALRAASGMGESLSLARGTLLAPPAASPDDSADVWLWLRHGDGAELLRFNPSEARPGAALPFRRPMPFARTPAGPLKFTADGDDLVASPDSTLLYLDRRAAVLWHVGRDGTATAWQSFAGYPDSLTAPARDGRGGWAMLAGDTRRFEGPAPAEDARIPAVPQVAARFPALLTLDGSPGELRVLDREAFTFGVGVGAGSLVPAWLAADAGPEAWVTFDSASGQLLRVKVVYKRRVQ